MAKRTRAEFLRLPREQWPQDESSQIKKKLKGGGGGGECRNAKEVGAVSVTPSVINFDTYSSLKKLVC